MKIIVTCGPSHESIDGARRLTNISTGKPGVTLGNVLADARHEVDCFKGEGGAFSDPVSDRNRIPITGFVSSDTGQ